MRTIEKLKNGHLFVRLISPTHKDIDRYYEDSGESRKTRKSTELPMNCQQAEIVETFDDTLYPNGSMWMCSDTKGRNINWFGKKYILIKESNLIAKLKNEK